MREVDRLLADHQIWQQRAVHEREVGEGEAGVLAGDPRAEEHLGEDGHAVRRQPGQARARGRGRHRSMGGPLGDEDRRREDDERHAEVRRDELGVRGLKTTTAARAATGR